jgi:peroxiredoxin
MKTLMVFFICLGFFSGNVNAQSTPVQNIPNFTFYRMNGQAFSKKDLTKDKKIVIVFFDITCDHCQHELKAMSDNYEKFKKAEFYLVSLDEVAGIKGFVSKYAPKMSAKPNVTLLRDFNREFIIKFLPVQYPAMYVFSPKGHLIKYFGQNSKIKDILTTVNN